MASVQFPNHVVIDIENVPEDFEEQIKKSFEEYTSGTADDYKYQDKLGYIDLIREYANKEKGLDGYEAVKQLMHERMDYLIENDELSDFDYEDEFKTLDFMSDCYERGREVSLHGDYTKVYRSDRYISHLSEKIEALIYRAIKVVIAWEPGD